LDLTLAGRKVQGELFSLTPADFPCYKCGMDTMPILATPLPEIGRCSLSAEMTFDGTNPPVVVAVAKTTMDGMRLRLPLFSLCRNRGLAPRQTEPVPPSAIALGGDASPAMIAFLD
jgi:hypothetical protein